MILRKIKEYIYVNVDHYATHNKLFMYPHLLFFFLIVSPPFILFFIYWLAVIRKKKDALTANASGRERN